MSNRVWASTYHLTHVPPAELPKARYNICKRVIYLYPYPTCDDRYPRDPRLQARDLREGQDGVRANSGHDRARPDRPRKVSREVNTHV